MPKGHPYPKEAVAEALRLWKETDLTGSLICKQTKIKLKSLYNITKGVPRTFREEQQAAQPKGRVENTNGTTPGQRATQRTTEQGTALQLSIIPQRYEIFSTNFWQAKAVCEELWGWDPMDPGRWLDTFLYVVFKERGIGLGAIQILNPQAVPQPVPEESEEGEDDEQEESVAALAG